MVWPGHGRALIMEGCVKVSVDDVIDEFKKLKVYSVTMTSELKQVEHMVDEIVQWPRDAIRLVNQGPPSKSLSAPRVDSSRGSQGRANTSSQMHDDDTTDTSSYRPQKVDEVHRDSSHVHADNMASSSCYRLVDEDDQVQMENPDPFKDGFLKAISSQNPVYIKIDCYICYRT
ncbi:uncharacterized protein LOC143583749 [Bidens hawaiensis]|uniref:uncharacterized protein LOC143583749 n=1 Tax=Bidens hawaiensis TaxID=980011 RepID=UPI00404B1DD0